MSGRNSSLKVCRTKVVVTAEHYLSTPVDDLVEALAVIQRGQVVQYGAERLSEAQSDRAMLKDFVRIVEGLYRHQFNELQRQVLNDFRPFSAGATGERLVLTQKAAERIQTKLLGIESSFLETVFQLLTAAHFQLLTKEEWDTATKEEFQCTLPMTVNLNVLDPSLPATFYSVHPDLRAVGPEEIRDHILVFHRGVQQEKLVHTDTMKRVQMIVEYVVLYPLMGAVLWLLHKLLKLTKLKFLSTAISSLEQSLPDNYLAVEAEEQQLQDTLKAEHDERVKGNVLVDANRGLRGQLFKVYERKSLRRTFPGFKACVKGILRKAELQEPCFQDIIVIYRLHEPFPDDQDTSNLSTLEKDLRKHNVCIKRFHAIPMADMEIIFPDRKLHLQPITLVSLGASIVGGIAAAYMMVAKTDFSMSMVISLLSLVGGRIGQVYGQAQAELIDTERKLNMQVYQKNTASQEAALLATLNDMLEQAVKEAVLLFFTLLAQRQPMKEIDVRKSAQKLLKTRFNVDLSLDVEHVLPQLLDWGIVKQSGDGMLTCLSLEAALAELDDRWDSCFTYTYNADSPVKDRKKAAANTLPARKEQSQEQVSPNVTSGTAASGVLQSSSSSQKGAGPHGFTFGSLLRKKTIVQR